MEHTKEEALQLFIKMIKESWTWARLTPKERERFLELLHSARYELTGTFKQRWKTLQNYYEMFLEGTGYYILDKWRPQQEDKDAPAF